MRRRCLASWKEHAARIRQQIDAREEEEVGRIEAGYPSHVDKLAALDAELTGARKHKVTVGTRQHRAKIAGAIAKLEKLSEKLTAKLADRDERVAEIRRHADDDREDVTAVGEELVALYADPLELLKHARVVGLDEIEDNEFNLNIPRYVDTFEPETRVEVKDALEALRGAESATRTAAAELSQLLRSAGYAN